MSRAKYSRRLWTAKETEYVKTHYPDTSTAKMAKTLSRGVGQVYQKAADLGLKKTPEYLSRSCRLQKGTAAGARFRFRKGHVPFNKGLRRRGWSPGRMRETQFRKGQRSGMAARNWVP